MDVHVWVYTHVTALCSHMLFVCDCNVRACNLEVLTEFVCVLCAFQKLNNSAWLVKCVCVHLPSGECCRGQLTDSMFLWTSSMGPGRWEILSLRSSANRARFSCSCLACREGSADVSVDNTEAQHVGKTYCKSLGKKNLLGLHRVQRDPFECSQLINKYRKLAFWRLLIISLKVFFSFLTLPVFQLKLNLKKKPNKQPKQS